MLSFEDKMLIKKSLQCKIFFARRLLKEFPTKNRSLSTNQKVKELLK